MIKVLLVDDQPQVRRGLRMRLALESDLQVVGEAADGEQALSLAGALKPDVVIMDYEMPHMDGIAATANLIARLPMTIVIIMSIHDNPTIRERAIAAGAIAFLTKSAGVSALLAEIRRAMGRLTDQPANH